MERVIGVGDGTWVGIAAVIAAIGSATSAIIAAITGRKVDKLNGKDKP